jgi:diacylglycerol kinase family enzyme
MQTLAIISNPYNRASRRDPKLHLKLAKVLGDRGLLRVTKTLDELTATVAEFRRMGINRIAVVGGDGSINLLLENILRFYEKEALPQVFLLRGGTANVLAMNLGIHGSPARVLKEFLTPPNPAEQCREVVVQSLLVNGRIGFQFANGVAARFLQTFYQNKGSIVQAGALLLRTTVDALKPAGSGNRAQALLTSAIPMRLETEPPLAVARSSRPESYSVIFVSTIPKMAMGIPIFSSLPLGSSHAGILAAQVEDRALAAFVARAVARKSLAHPEVRLGAVSHAQIETKKGEPYTIDGELFEAPEEGVTIGLGPRFRFALPG